MNSERSHPPALAFFLLRYLCPKDNREVLIGDLLETFREGRSDGWFWRQVFIAVLLGVSKELRLRWPQICFAVAGTLVLVLEGWIMRLPAIEGLWARGISLQWPLATAYDFGFHGALAAVMLQPFLAVLLLLGRRFSWHSLLRTFLISFLLLVVSDVGLFLSAPHLPSSAYRPPPPTFWAFARDVLQFRQPSLMLTFLSTKFFILLISVWFGCSSSVRARESTQGAATPGI